MQAQTEERAQTVSSEYENGTLSVWISGDIDHHAAAPLRQKVDAEIYFYRPKTVLLGFRDVDFMDSAGLGFFMGRWQLCRTLGASFRLVDPPPRVMRILTLSGLDRHLPIERVYHDRNAARGTAQSVSQGTSQSVSQSVSRNAELSDVEKGGESSCREPESGKRKS